MEFTDELLAKIFDFLDINTLIGRCSKVNKQWRESVKLIRVDSLFIGNKNSSEKNCCLNLNYEITYEPINQSDRYYTNVTFQYLKSKIFRSILSELRQLLIVDLSIRTKPDWTSFEKTLNGIETLEHLQINTLFNNKDRLLQLNNIKILTILSFSSNKPIRVNAAKLSKICCIDGFDNLLFNYSNRITHLITGMYHESLNQYGNVEYVYLRNDNLKRSLENVIAMFTDFSKLKELHMRLIDKEYIFKLIKQKRVAKNVSLKMYFNDFHVDGQNDAKKLERIDDNFMFKNYKKLAQVITFVNEIDYGKVINYFGRLPSDFHARFVNLTTVSIQNVENCQSQFTVFIHNCKILKKLYITNAHFNQTFYDDLHIHCQFITTLCIKENDKSFVNNLNLNFVFKLEWMDEFSVDRKVTDYDQVEKIYEKLNKIKRLGFILKDCKLELEFTDSGKLMLADYNMMSNKKDEALNALGELFKLAETDSFK